MPSSLESFEELEGECFEGSKLRVLPERSMQGAIDEAIKDAWRLCRSRWAKEIEVHRFLVRAGGDGAIQVELDMYVLGGIISHARVQGIPIPVAPHRHKKSSCAA